MEDRLSASSAELNVDMAARSGDALVLGAGLTHGKVGSDGSREQVGAERG
jgi:hypothetical protein